MDSDRWDSRLTAAKMRLSLQYQQDSTLLERLTMGDFEVVEEELEGYPCPHCSEDHDIESLCAHLVHDHFSESLCATICPICYMEVARDLLIHISMQHAPLFKMQRHRQSHRVTIRSSQSLSFLGRDLREAHLHARLSSGGFRASSGNAPAAIPDSIFSSLRLDFPTSEEAPKPMVSAAEDTLLESVAPSKALKPELDPSLSNEEREQKVRQAADRALFVRNLVLSTLFGD